MANNLRYLLEHFCLDGQKIDISSQLDEENANNIEKINTQTVPSINTRIDDIKNTLLEDNIEKKRKSILDFCSSLSNDQKQNSEAFNDIFRTYADYEQILKDNGMENGQAEESMKFIREKYQEKLHNGEFNI